MSLHITTIHNIIMCVNVSNLDVFTLKNKHIFIGFTAIYVHLSQIVMCTKAILCILLN